MFAVPLTAVPSTATVVRPGAPTIHSARPSSSVISGSYANVSAAVTTSRTIGQIAGQSHEVASRMRRLDSAVTVGALRVSSVY